MHHFIDIKIEFWDIINQQKETKREDFEERIHVYKKNYIVKYETYLNIPPCLRHIYDSAGV